MTPQNQPGHENENESEHELEQRHGPAIPLAPPIPAHEIRPRPSRWPKVIGVISVVLGSLGVLGGICGTLAMVVGQGVMTLAAQQQQGASAVQAMQDQTSFTVLSLLTGLLLALFLLVAGVVLICRRRRGVTLLKVWAVCRIVAVGVGSVIGYFVGVAQMEVMQQTTMGSNQPPPGMASFITGGMILLFVLGLLWGWAWPIFVLIWLRRQKIRDDYSTWGQRPIAVATPPPI